MANQANNKFKFELLSGNIDFDTDVFKVLLFANGQVPDIDADHTLTEISAKELAAGNGYSTGGLTLAGVTVTEDDANDKGVVAWNDAVWTASGGDIGPSPYAAIYKLGGTNPVIGFIDFGGNKTSTDGETFKLTAPGVEI